MATAATPSNVQLAQISNDFGMADPFYSQMEETGEVAQNYWPTEELSGGFIKQETQALPPIDVPEKYKGEVARILSEMMEIATGKPVAERLLELTHRVASVVEGHLFGRKSFESEEKERTLEKLQTQVGLKNWQAFSQAGGGFGGAILSFVGAMLSGTNNFSQIGDVMKKMAEMTPLMSKTADSYLDGKIMPLQFDQSLFLNTASTKAQEAEGMKRLVEQLRNLIMEVQRNRQQSTNATFQGR